MQFTRSKNRSRFIATTLAGVTTTKPGIAGATGMSQPTVWRLAEELIREGIIVESAPRGASQARPGRAPTTISINPDFGKVVGIDLGGTNCRFLLADSVGACLSYRAETTPTALGAEELAEWIHTQALELSRSARPEVPLSAVAIGVPGVVAGDKDRIVSSVNLPQISGTAFLDALYGLFDLPLLVDNDSNLALSGELRLNRDARFTQSTDVLLVLGTGVRAAISINGEILSGSEGVLGEFGRLQLPGTDLRVRDYISGAGLLKVARAEHPDVADVETLFRQPEEYAAIIRRVGATLQHACSILALAYEPQTIYFTGGLSGAFSDDQLSAIQESIRNHLGIELAIARSGLGNSAGILGAMLLAHSQLYVSIGVDAQDLIYAGSSSETTLATFQELSIGSVAVDR